MVTKFVKFACFYILFCVCAYAAAAVTAMCLFFGTNDYNPQPGRYDFWASTLSELGEPSKYSPPSVLYAWMYNVGLMLVGSALAPLFWVLPGLLAPRPRLRLAVRWLGMLSVGGAVGVGLTPADTMGFRHTVAIGCAAVPGVTAMALGCWGLVANPARSVAYRTMTAVFLLLAATHFSQYVWHFWLGFEWTWVSTSTQKFAIMSGLVWMGWTAVLVKKGLGDRV